jgi:uncharacterized protein YoxC
MKTITATMIALAFLALLVGAHLAAEAIAGAMDNSANRIAAVGR